MKEEYDNLFESNRCQVAGEVYSEFKESHVTFGEIFYTFELGVKRKSGYVDIINVIVSDKLLLDGFFEIGDTVSVLGQIRTYNNSFDGRNHLSIVIFAREINNNFFTYDVNDIYIMGYICKEPVKRTSPLGREICDVMLAVNRMYNKSDYIPCIAWGRNASYAASLPIGSKVLIDGRLQSRNYRKKMDDGSLLEKTAYEVSIINLEEY